MSEFVQAISPGGVLLLPRPVLLDLPAPTEALRDIELLTRTPEQVAELSDDEVIDGLSAVRRRRSEAEAQEARLLARLHELRGGDRYVPDEAALELRISVGAAATRVAHSVALVRRMPNVLQALTDGELDGYTAGRLTEVCRTLSDEAAREVDHRWGAKRALGTVNFTDPANVRRGMHRLAIAVDPDAAATRAKQARNERKVQLISGEDTMSRLIADLPAELAAAAYGTVDKLARRLRNTGDQRTLDQLRADVLADLLTSNGNTGGGKGGAMVFLHMPITTALTMTEDGCELSGYGPIPAPIARDIMTNPTSLIRKVLVDPGTGQIDGLGRTRRRPNQELRDLIAARDRECGHCTRPATACDLDHIKEWVRDRGPTDPHNLVAKCEKLHYLKDHPDWDITDTDPEAGELSITTPAKRTYPRKRHPILDREPVCIPDNHCRTSRHSDHR